jgi:hypothetical protein
MVEKMFKKTYNIFIFSFSIVLILLPSIAFLAENKINDKEFHKIVDKGLKDLPKIDSKKVNTMTKEVLKTFAKHLRELGYHVDASDKFIDKRVDEIYNSVKEQKFTNEDLKILMEVTSKTLEDFIRYIIALKSGDENSINKAHYNSNELYNNFLNSFQSNLENSKKTQQVSTPTTGLSTPITIAFGMIRAIVGGLTGAGALGSGLLAAIMTAVDFGISIVPVIFCAILAGLIFGVLGLFAGGIISAIIAGIIGFFVPTLMLVILVVFILFLTVMGGLGATLGTMLSGIITVFEGFLGNIGSFLQTIFNLLVSFGAAFLPLIAIGIAILGVIFGIVLLPIALILGIPFALIFAPAGFIFGSLAAPTFGFIGGSVIGGIGGLFITQMVFLPLIVFICLFTFVLGTAAYMMVGPIIGSTNDYLTPFSKGIYSIYLNYKNMSDSEFFNNINKLLLDILNMMENTFNMKITNTIKSLEIIVDTTDFSDANEINKATEEILIILQTIIY